MEKRVLGRFMSFLFGDMNSAPVNINLEDLETDKAT